MRSECVGLRKELAAEKRAKAQFSAKLEDLLTEKEEVPRRESCLPQGSLRCFRRF